jgi:DNA polymerase III subunit delta
MTPDQFLAQVRKSKPAPAYLWLGPEIYQRGACRSALLDLVLGEKVDGERDGFFPYDLEETPLAAICDDARAYSLFSPRRVFWITRAEAVLPRGRAVAAAAADDEDAPGKGSATALANYLADPSTDTVLVFDSSKFEFDGDDKAKTERVRKFYAGIAQVVEFPHWTVPMTRKLAQDLVRDAALKIGVEELNLLVEAVGGSPARVAVEIEKLRLYAGSRAVSSRDIASLVPQAQATTIFALVAALGRRERQKALDLLDTLVREGEYLPLALSFLATQFRQALVSQEAGLRGAMAIQGHFAKSGVPMWPSRAEQIAQTMSVFTPAQLKTALGGIARADKGLRDIRPDDRTVLEDFVLALTSPAR